MPEPSQLTISLYINNSEENALTKSLTDIITLTGHLRDGCSIIDPIILIEWNNPSHWDISDLVKCNYLIIPQYGRKYFIRNTEILRTGLVQLTCHVDVLSSFADEIRANTGIVHRQQNQYNLYLNDGVLKCYQNPSIATLPFPNDCFVGRTNVLLIAGGRDSGYTYGAGASGAGNTSGKTTSGLVNYATAQLGKPYWYGTCGQTASEALYLERRYRYEKYYTASDFPSQYGQRVHDCVGLIKGYRWSDTPTSTPVPVQIEDVDVNGMWRSCVKAQGTIPPVFNGLTIGCLVFNGTLDHVGVYIGNGNVIEARNHASGVVQTALVDRTFVNWGIPDWLTVTTDIG